MTSVKILIFQAQIQQLQNKALGSGLGVGGKEQGGGDDQVLTIEAAGLHSQGAGKWPEVAEAKPQP